MAAAKLVAKSLDVPGDLSSAVFFIAAASLFPESSLLIHNVGLNPTRTAILDLFASMGAAIQMPSLRSAHGEIVGDLAVKGAALKGGVIEGEQIALLIDELPMLAALGPYTENGIEIRDAAELRVKESDRIAALAENLKRMGATSGRAARWLESRRTQSGEIARRGNRSERRSSHRHGLRGGRSGCRRRDRDSRRGMRGRFLSCFFRRFEARGGAVKRKC